jgi:nucleoside diphosphate kinase
MVRNSAFVFIKPHAVTEKTKELVKETFEKNKINVKTEGSVDAEQIDKKMLVDKHYYSIASKATLVKPDKLNIPKDKFKDKFGLDFDTAVSEGKCLNAKDACEVLEIDGTALDSLWAAAKKAGDLVKFGGGFYCAKLAPQNDKESLYVFNGFFMSMRGKFVVPGSSIYYYIVEWESKDLSWKDFRGTVLGATDPATATAGSLRNTILLKWKELGLTSEPNVGDNGVHASASPFEGLAERMNWLGYRAERDPFGKLLLRAGVSPKVIREWCKDPQVTYGPIPMTQSLFDGLEDTDSDWCLALCQIMANACGRKPPVNYDEEIERLTAELEAYKPLEKAALAIQAYAPPVDKKGKKDKSEPKAEPKKRVKKGAIVASEEPKKVKKGNRSKNAE